MKFIDSAVELSNGSIDSVDWMARKSQRSAKAGALRYFIVDPRVLPPRQAPNPAASWQKRNWPFGGNFNPDLRIELTIRDGVQTHREGEFLVDAIQIGRASCRERV